MLLRRFTIFFTILFVFNVIQSVVSVRNITDVTIEFEEITDETTPILLFVNNIQSEANKIVGDTTSLALLIENTDEVIELDFALLTDAQYKHHEDDDLESGHSHGVGDSTDEVEETADDAHAHADEVEETDSDDHAHADEVEETDSDDHAHADEVEETDSDDHAHADEVEETADDAHAHADEVEETADDDHAHADEVEETADDAHAHADEVEETDSDAHAHADEVEETADDAHAHADEVEETADDAHAHADEVEETDSDDHAHADEVEETADDDHAHADDEADSENTGTINTSNAQAVNTEFEELVEAVIQIHADIVELDVFISDSVHHTLANDLHDATTALVVAGQELILTAQTSNDVLLLLDARADLDVAEGNFEAIISIFVNNQQTDLNNLRIRANERVDESGQLAILLSVMRGAIIVILLILIWYWVLRPINGIRATAEEIAQGKFTMKVDQKSDGEIGSLEAALNQMLQAIQQRDTKLTSLNEELVQRATEAEEARGLAEKSNQVKSAFLASMSHELRTPLNAIINYAKFVAQGDLGDVNEDQQDTLMEVVDNGKHLLFLINEVLDMSKIESGSFSLFVQDGINVKELIDTVVKSGEALIEDKEIELRTSIPDDFPTIRADGQRIRQILTNLVSNAIKFTNEGYVEIHATYDTTNITLSVKDTGMGISSEDFERIFDAFQQSESGLRAGGTGLGLPISKEIATLHGGRIWLESETGNGSTFYLELPIKSEKLEVLLIN